ncbi:MAG: hypothetical protein KU28_01655 [Sulfurovum sp. PC08-66]|nr:MAG: hypothetical protein KU28_01655 [Sulfurovum sp. PC08-66]KIM12642.1 MAG: hypothetical protein KU37_01760 [Sulfuricurvum sp. PC08-66]
MKYFNTFLLALIMAAMSGCTIAHPSFDSSNQKILENRMSDMELGQLLKTKLPSGANVALRSMEQKRTLDKPVDTLIQDVTIRSLVQNGFRPLERDEDALAHLRLEDDNTLKVEVPQKSITDTLEAENMELKSVADLHYIEENLVQSKLRSADYILSYRVLETGVKYHSTDDGFQWEDLGTLRFWFEPLIPWAFLQEVERESMIRLHVRAINAKSGEIIFAQNVHNLQNERVEKSLAKKLEDYHYDFFTASLPAQSTLSSEDRIDAKTATAATAQTSKDFWGKVSTFVVGVGVAVTGEESGTVSSMPAQNVEPAPRLGADYLVGLDGATGYGVHYRFDFGRVGYLGLNKTSTDVYTGSTAIQAGMYTYEMGRLQLHAGYAMTTIGSTSSNTIAWGASYKAIDFLNLTVHYYSMGDAYTNMMVSAGLAF